MPMLPHDRRYIMTRLDMISRLTQNSAESLTADQTLEEQLELVSDDLNQVVEWIQELNQRILLLKGNR